MEPSIDYPWHNERRPEVEGEPTGRRLHWTVLLAGICSLLLHLLLILLFSDIQVAFPSLGPRDPLAFRIPQVEVTEQSLRPPVDNVSSASLDAANIPDLIEEKEIDLSEIQDKIPDDREIAITPEVQKPENIAPGAEAAAGLALESLNVESFENSLETLSATALRVPDIAPVASENQPMIEADSNGEAGGKSRDLLEKAARGNEGLSDRFSTLDELMGIPGGKLTDITKPIYMPSDLLFDFNEDRLREGAKTSMMMLGILMDRNRDTIFIIEGHTDSIGSDDRNLDLSRRRAEAVGNWLQQSLRISPDRMRIEAHGESRPLVSPDGSIEEQQPNRRVEIRMIRPGQSPGEAAPAPSPAPGRPAVLATPPAAPMVPDNEPVVRPARPIAEPEPATPPVRPARLVEP